MRVCHCSLAGTEACNHCSSGTSGIIAEPWAPALDWRDEIIATLRAENARWQEEARQYCQNANYWRVENAKLREFARVIADGPWRLATDLTERESHFISLARNLLATLSSQTSEAKGESGEDDELRNALQLMVDAVMKHGDATQALSIARAILSRKPAEERGPEVGDLIYWRGTDGVHANSRIGFWRDDGDTDYASQDLRYPIILMRRAEVEARVKGEK